MSDVDKELRKLWRELERQGWRRRLSRTSHQQWYSPDGRTIVTVGTSVSDWRALRNVRRDVRRGGAQI